MNLQLARADGGGDAVDGVEAVLQRVKRGIVVIQSVQIDIDEGTGDQAGAFLLDVNHEAAVGGCEVEIAVGGIEDGSCVGNGVAGGDLGEAFEALAGGVKLVQFENQIGGESVHLVGHVADIGSQT